MHWFSTFESNRSTVTFIKLSSCGRFGTLGNGILGYVARCVSRTKSGSLPLTSFSDKVSNKPSTYGVSPSDRVKTCPDPWPARQRTAELKRQYSEDSISSFRPATRRCETVVQGLRFGTSIIDGRLASPGPRAQDAQVGGPRRDIQQI
jgi:hypothetical protein